MDESVDSVDQSQRSLDVDYQINYKESKNKQTDYDRLIEEAMNSNPTRLSYMRQGFANDD